MSKQGHTRLPILLALLVLAIGLKYATMKSGYFMGVVLGDSCYPDLKHLDLVIYHTPTTGEVGLGDHIVFVWYSGKTLKEVVALPGDEVCLRNIRVDTRKEAETRLFVNGRPTHSPYVYTWGVCDDDSSLRLGGKVVLQKHEYLLMPTNKIGAEKCAYIVKFGSIKGRVVMHYSVLPERVVLGFRRVFLHEALVYQQETLRGSKEF
ncbi:MAG: S26 family signal peptidase [Candidatus Berkelbacteria bacterium]|nr:S26 family signal peptidase [Candidatus Berkelbacteria bacterium]